jgi:cell division protein FtsB
VRRLTFTTRATLLALVICVLVLTLAYPLRLYIKQQGDIRDLAAGNAAQRQRVAALKAQVAHYDDPNWVRNEARARLHYTQPGEKDYLLPSTTSPRPGGDPAADATHGPWYSRLLAGALATPTTTPAPPPATGAP